MLSDRVRRTLVQSLYAQPTSLAIGLINGILCATITGLVSGQSWLLLGGVVLALIGIVRLIAALRISPASSKYSVRQLELFYEAGAFSYSFVLGMIAAATLLLDVQPGLQLLMVVNSACYGLGSCVRNAGRPATALGQLILSCTPVLLACLWIGTIAFYALAVTIILLIPAIAAITINIFTTLRDSIGSADTNARLAERMRSLARTDVVTDLSNRAAHNSDLVERLNRMPADRHLALFWIDLDRFKEVNDLLGHPVGDRVLREVAGRLRDFAPPDTSISRFGGDEFILFCEVADRAESEALARRLHERVTRPLRIDRERLEIHASIGVSLFPDDCPIDDSPIDYTHADTLPTEPLPANLRADLLMQNADLALYHAKDNGRQQTCFYTPAMTRDLARRREIEAELRVAIENDELSIYFQPIVDLQTGRIRAFEALVRWFHPTKGELPPEEFIPVAEETGVIITLGNWIAVRAIKAAANWPGDITVAVNLSPMQIKAPGATLGLMKALQDSRLAPSRLELEVTENLLIDDNAATEAFMVELAAMGVRFVLDDFGTGYSSLSYIQRYPFSKIKIDRSFVSGPNAGDKTDAIIFAVAQMGSKLNMGIAAEGLETIDQVNTVREAGCTLGQGFYFSRAVPEYMIDKLLEKHSGYLKRQVQLPSVADSGPETVATQ